MYGAESNADHRHHNMYVSNNSHKNTHVYIKIGTKSIVDHCHQIER